jgi:hypothetical protein
MNLLLLNRFVDSFYNVIASVVKNGNNAIAYGCKSKAVVYFSPSVQRNTFGRQHEVLERLRSPGRRHGHDGQVGEFFVFKLSYFESLVKF